MWQHLKRLKQLDQSILIQIVEWEFQIKIGKKPLCNAYFHFLDLIFFPMNIHVKVTSEAISYRLF